MGDLLVFGGVRFTGRAIVMEALRSGRYNHIRVVDRVRPETEFFQRWESIAFSHVEVMTLNLGNEDGYSMMDAAFTHPSGGKWDVVVNAYFEGAHVMGETTHRNWTVNPALQIARAVRHYAAGVLVHITAASFCFWNIKLGKLKEDHEFTAHPKNVRSKSIVDAEKASRSVEGISLLVLRVGDIYGHGSPCHVDQMMMVCRTFLEGGQTHYDIPFRTTDYMNTIHVHDLARAVHHTTEWYERMGLEGEKVFNLVNDDDTSQFSLQKVMAETMGLVARPCPGVIVFLFRHLRKYRVVAKAMHTSIGTSWARILSEWGIRATPLHLELDHESFATPWTIQLDGSAIKEETGFTLLYPNFTKEVVWSMFAYWNELGIWPNIEEKTE